MSKSKEPAALQSPAKWQLVSWQKKDEQYARIPHDWRLRNLPSQHVTNYIDIPRKCGLLSKEELSITEEYDATALADAIRARKLKCIDVTRAFCKVR
jgi:amidase